MRGFKLHNEYAAKLPHRIYEGIPKAVFAAIAVSLATGGGERLDEAQALILNEWQRLFENGIVPQKPMNS